MDVQELKAKIIEDNKIHLILSELGMKHIKPHSEYYSCGMPDGDNKSSTIVYRDSLFVDAYTRDISDKNGCTDIVSLVSFVNDSFFSSSIKWICDICGYDYYGKKEEVPSGLKWMREISKLKNKSDQDEEDLRIRPIEEDILSYYKNVANSQFEKDGISISTQCEFEIGLDLETHRITIPIRDEIGTLVGIKGRLFGSENLLSDMKYIYLFKCPKSKILFGLNKTYPYIKRKGFVYVFESEKAVLQMWSNGIKNCVAIGNHKISRRQSDILTKLGVDIIFCYDKEIGVNTYKDEDDNIKIKLSDKGSITLDRDFWEKQTRNFINGQKYGIMYDRYNILDDKESPSDNFDRFKSMQENIVYKTVERRNNEV